MNSSQSPNKLTPTHAISQELGAHFVELAGWQVPQLFSNIEDEVAIARRSVALTDRSASGKILVEGHQGETVLQEVWTIPSLAIGQGVLVDSKQVFCLREDLYFVLLDPGKEDAAVTALRAEVEKSGKLITVTDMTHGWANLLLAGPNSSQLLRRLCSLDFQPNQFPDLSAKQSSVAKTRQLIVRHDIKSRDERPIPAFSLIGVRSLAVYLWQTIREAGHDLDLALIGQSALDQLRAGN